MEANGKPVVFGAPYSVYVRAVRLALEEKGVAATTRDEDGSRLGRDCARRARYHATTISEDNLVICLDAAGLRSDPKGPLFRTIGRDTLPGNQDHHLPEEKAAEMANHAATRTTRLCDRRHDEIGLDEVERIAL
jgi:hypothetical protein